MLEFYDQPPAIKLIYQAKNGRPVGVWHTPDYFVLRADGIGWEEWKMDAALGGHIETDVIRAYWSLRSLMEIRWSVSTATARRRRSHRVAVLNSLSASS